MCMVGVKSRSGLHLRSISDTSDNPYSFTPILFRLLIFLPNLLSSYLLCSVSVHPCLSFSVQPFCFHATVDLTSCPFDRSSAFPPIPVPAPPLDSELLLYLNPLYLLIQPNLIIASYSAVALLPFLLSHSVNLLQLILCLWTPSDSGLRPP